ncbi:hypothetical protein [Rhodanobacter caeni]|uniref:Uncharacterized protein n=1 Tax=Rhodanobacter caeni TaxID=657654 RepID=A0ABN0UHQ8_9GAMM
MIDTYHPLDARAAQDLETQASEIASALRVLQPKAQHRKGQLFALLYPVIVELLEKSVTQKAILKVLEAKGLKLHPTRFNELMASANKAHSKAGTETNEEGEA